MKTIVIDGQILQTGAWHRGMGKYTLQLLTEMSKHAGNDGEVVFYLMFNTRLSNDPERFKTIEYLCPGIKHISLSLPLATDKDATPKAYKRALDLQLSGIFGDQELSFLLTSLFFFDFYAEYPTNAHKSLLFYDLTPLLFWRDLGGYFPPDLYMRRFRQILEADTIYSISDTTKGDLIKTFGLEYDTVVNINGGFSKIAAHAQKPAGFSVPLQYVLFPTGDLPHKNNEVAVEGFEKYVQKSNKAAKLLITSHFSEESKAKLRTLSSSIIFTENVPDEELEWLYRNADAVLFASKYEGLGIPILDAVANDKPVITSRISVFEEMSKEAFYYFNPSDPNELAEQLDRALHMSGFDTYQANYAQILARYSWAETFSALWAQMKKTDSKSNPAAQARTRRKRIAVACIHPGIEGQIGRRAEAMHVRLARQYDVDYYFDPNGLYYREMERPTFLDFVADKTYDISRLSISAYRKYDLVIFLLDKSSFPSRLVQRSVVFPGLALCSDSLKKSSFETALRPLFELASESQIMATLEADNEARIEGAMKIESSRKTIITKHVSRQTIMKTLLKERDDK